MRENNLLLEDITIVIPTLGRPILKESLHWIASGSAWPKELVVVDQGTNQKVEAWIENLRIDGINSRHVHSSQRGKASALNRGIELVKTRFVVITDDDCFAGPGWLEAMANRLQEMPEAIITGPALAEGDETAVAEVNLQEPVLMRVPRMKFETFCGSNMGVAKNVVERIGMFDEDPRLVAAEDSEFAYRALRSGVPIRYDPEISVRHYGWRDQEERAKRYKVYALSHGGFYGKYLRRGDWFIALRAVIHFMRALRRWLRGITTGNREFRIKGQAYLVNLLPGIIAGMRRGRTL